jgi:S-formylglutathione hydrolase FrmB
VLPSSAIALAAALGALDAPSVPQAGRWLEPTTVAGHCLGHAVEGRGQVRVYLPRGYPGRGGWPLAIALHGWMHAPARWAGLGLAGLADRHGVVVVAPEMGSSVYERSFYPETRRAWGGLPGACWIAEVVLPWAQRTLAVSHQRSRTAILGYSTGGRGALVVAGRTPRFAFAGSLSGTYDLGLLQPGEGEYAIHEEVFGGRAGREGRWREEDVWPLLPALAGTRLFLAHGAEDRVVRPDQLEALRRRLGPGHGRAVLVEVGGAGHDEAFWRLELPALFAALAEALGLPSVPAAE